MMGFLIICSSLPNLHMQAFRSPRLCRVMPPQSEHHGRSGVQKVAKMEPKMMTFRGHAEKLKSEPGLGESTVEAVPGGPRITQNSMLFLKALPEAHF